MSDRLNLLVDFGVEAQCAADELTSLADKAREVSARATDDLQAAIAWLRRAASAHDKEIGLLVRTAEPEAPQPRPALTVVPRERP